MKKSCPQRREESGINYCIQVCLSYKNLQLCRLITAWRDTIHARRYDS